MSHISFKEPIETTETPAERYFADIIVPDNHLDVCEKFHKLSIVADC